MINSVTYSAVLSWNEICLHLDTEFKIQLAKKLHYSLSELSLSPILTSSIDKNCIDIFHVVEVE